MEALDTNNDKKISKAEFEAINKDAYNEKFHDIISDTQTEISYDYDNLYQYLDDGYISMEELEGNVTSYGLKGKGLEEVHNLKDVSQMSRDEMIDELTQYGINDTENKKDNEIKDILLAAREERSKYDKNSNIVDGHIGTFVQSRDNNMCTVLSVLETMSDEQIQSMYEKKTDENGKVYYEITFPQDKNSGQSVIVTQEELDNMAITINENGQDREIVGFSTGDADVAMFEMAFVKRFGADTFENGSEIEISRQIFANPDEKIKRNTHLEEIENLDSLPDNTTISMLYVDEFIDKGVSMASFELEDGRTASFYAGKIILSDGTEITPNHAMSVRGYDSETQELIVSGNEFNSDSELRIPKELLKYFAMSLPEDFS